jgi:hypothetical protein
MPNAMHAVDSTGAASTMVARFDRGTWTFLGENIRFTGGFGEQATVFAGLWERRANRGASWKPLMDVVLRKIR